MAITKIGESQSFNYTGDIQIFTVPFDGIYKLEVYGAQGGSASGGIGGKGGYSTGYIKLNKNQILYVVVGGAGATATSVGKAYNGGYNGGAASVAWGNTYNGGGAGATHIATKTGLLSTLSSSVSNILIVAGGGGGAASNGSSHAAGGTGGGNSGTEGAPPPNNDGSRGLGGTQTEGGGVTVYNRTAPSSGSFGQGGAASVIGGAGGGAGYYGGGGAGVWGGAGGGSGYINGVPTINYKGISYSPSMSNGSRSGDGIAIITLITKTFPTMYLGSTLVDRAYLGTTELNTFYINNIEL